MNGRRIVKNHKTKISQQNVTPFFLYDVTLRMKGSVLRCRKLLIRRFSMRKRRWRFISGIVGYEMVNN